MGYGRVGCRIASALGTRGIPYVVAEQTRKLVEDLLSRAIPSMFGNAAESAVLIQAHIAHAATLVVATPDPVDVRRNTPGPARFRAGCAEKSKRIVDVPGGLDPNPFGKPLFRLERPDHLVYQRLQFFSQNKACLVPGQHQIAGERNTVCPVPNFQSADPEDVAFIGIGRERAHGVPCGLLARFIASMTRLVKSRSRKPTFSV